MAGADSVEAAAGDVFVIHTPGGGGFGADRDMDKTADHD
jgi:N-methylhydantoinase B/oxoprolinase/acetone carboxylase alpha subunit